MTGSLHGLLAQGVVALSLFMTTMVQAQPAFDRVVVFGDSLSDSGNAGRFSNGRVWVEVLAQDLGLSLTPSEAGGSNFAVGGARLDPGSGPHSLRAQADMFLSNPHVPGRTLFAVWGGANDLFAAMSDLDADEKITDAVRSLHGILADLLEQGATDLLVPNLPDIGMTPSVAAHGERPVEEAHRLTTTFNIQVDKVIRELALGISPPPRFYRLDVHAMAQQVIASPAETGFTNVRVPCRDHASCDGYLFWDEVHPTAYAHERLAKQALSEIQASD